MAPAPQTHWYQAYFQLVRWYSRYRSITAGIPKPLANDFHTRDYAAAGTRLGFTLSDATAFFYDDVIAYFQSCYHLKDWIKKDPDAARAGLLVEAFITATPSLALAADICNGTKHLGLDRAPRSGSEPSFMGQSVIQNAKYDTLAMTFRIDTSTGSQDAFPVATEALKAWNEFISVHLLATVEPPWDSRVRGHIALWPL